MNVPGEHLQGVMSANEFLTRVNLMQGHSGSTRRRCRKCTGKQVIVIGGGNTAMDAARTARRLGGHVTIVYRRTQARCPRASRNCITRWRKASCSRCCARPSEFVGDNHHRAPAQPILDIMELGDPTPRAGAAPVVTGKTEIMNGRSRHHGARQRRRTRSSRMPSPRLRPPNGAPSPSSAARRRPRSRACSPAATRRAAARPPSARLATGRRRRAKSWATIPSRAAEIKELVAKAARYTASAQTPQTIVEKIDLSERHCRVRRALAADRAGRAGRPVRARAGVAARAS